MVFHITIAFNNISVLSWRSVLLEEDDGLPRENPPQVTDTPSSTAYLTLTMYIITILQ